MRDCVHEGFAFPVTNSLGRRTNRGEHGFAAHEAAASRDHRTPSFPALVLWGEGRSERLREQPTQDRIPTVAIGFTPQMEDLARNEEPPPRRGRRPYRRARSAPAACQPVSAAEARRGARAGEA